MSKDEKFPEIRFKGFDDNWGQRKLSKIATMHARIGWQNLRTSEFLDNGDFYLITGTDFVDGRIDLSTCHYISKGRYDQDKNIQINNGSILITKDGTLGKVAYVENLDKPATLNAGVFNVEIIVEDVDEKYLYQYLKAPFLMDYVEQKATGGTIKHLNQSILVDFPVPNPILFEQKEIGNFFMNIDRFLDYEQRKYIQLENMKSTLLEKMFPHDDAKVPEIRFTGFVGNWEEKRLEELCTVTSGVMGDSLLSKGKYCLTRIETISEGIVDEQRVGYTNVRPDDIFLLKEGDILYSNINSIGQMGKVAEYKGNGKLYHGINTLRLSPNEMIYPDFLLYFLSTSSKREWADTHANQAVSQASINKTLLESQNMLVCSISEQKKIGDFFCNLDNYIVLQQHKIDQLQNIKQSFLDKMFVS